MTPNAWPQRARRRGSGSDPKPTQRGVYRIKVQRAIADTNATEKATPKPSAKDNLIADLKAEVTRLETLVLELGGTL
jgi:hypothetical protein